MKNDKLLGWINAKKSLKNAKNTFRPKIALIGLVKYSITTIESEF